MKHNLYLLSEFSKKKKNSSKTINPNNLTSLNYCLLHRTNRFPLLPCCSALIIPSVSSASTQCKGPTKALILCQSNNQSNNMMLHNSECLIVLKNAEGVKHLCKLWFIIY